MKCSNCGTEFEGNFCPKCRASASNEQQIRPDVDDTQGTQPAAGYSQPVMPQPVQKAKKPIFKKWWFWVIIAVVIIIIIAAASGSGSGGTNDVTTDPAETTSGVAVGQKDNDTDNKLNVKILKTSIGEDYEKKPVLIVEYEFTNTTKSASSFSTLCTDKAFQNGVECSSITVTDGVDSQRMLNEVQPGTTYTVSEAYVLSDTTTPVNITVGEWIGSDVYFEQTINLQ